MELLDGTVAENIARFGPIEAARVVEAAQSAGIHEMVLTLPQAYDTPLIGGGVMLSAGQQQRIGIARAIYGHPRVVVLDEPNANLDMAGEAALLKTIRQLQQDGCTVVVVTHRTNVLQAAQKIALIVQGKLALYGPREEVVAAMAQPQPAVSSPKPSTGPRLERAMPATPELQS